MAGVDLDWIESMQNQQLAPQWKLPQCWGVCLLLLMLVTAPLWFGSPRSNRFPVVGLVGDSSELPAWTGNFLSIATVVCVACAIMFPVRLRAAWWLVSASLAGGFLWDQHRLQPWAYQSAIYATVFASMQAERARRWLIPMASSLYLYSAAGKFDYQFAHTVGQDFLGFILRSLGSSLDQVELATRVKLAEIIPATEFLGGLSLLFDKTRRLGAAAVITMHAVLVIILSPVGLNHSTGVLVWNIALMVQAYLLFWRQPAAEIPNDRPVRSHRGAALARLFVLVALIAPLSERYGYWDHWTSWSLYSPHTSRVEIEIHRSAVPLLGPSLSRFLEEDGDGDGWSRLSIEDWSLSSRKVPIYPQARYQLSLANQLAQRYQLDRDIRARLRGRSDRWTGRRLQRLFLGKREISNGLQSFWLTP